MKLYPRVIVYIDVENPKRLHRCGKSIVQGNGRLIDVG